MEKLLQPRRGRPEDAAALATFAARTFADAFGAANRAEHVAAHVAASYGPPQQSAELANPDYVTLVVGDAPDFAAYAQVRRHEAPACVTGEAPVEVYRFYVDRPWQGRGLAQHLMECAHNVAHELGGRSLWLSVWEHNPRGIAFYTKCGFRDVGTADFYVGPDRQTDRIMVVPVQPNARTL
jgi:ribosomal protein S18 acetylase RimI-like enzyme